MTAKDPTEQVVLKYLTLFGAEIQKTQTCYEILAPLELAKALEGLPIPTRINTGSASNRATIRKLR